MTLATSPLASSNQAQPTLKQGDGGTWVIALQHTLNGCGHTVKVDGQFGTGTLGAVETFQKALGLLGMGVSSGVVESKTWDALDTHKKLPGWMAFVPTPQGLSKKIDRKEFFTRYRSSASFLSTLNQTQVAGYDAIFDYWEDSTLNDLRWLAYILATAYHETGATIEPVREGFCKTDDCSIRAVANLLSRGIIARNYALPHPNENSYFGRGLVQLTHGFNYEKMGKALGLEMLLYDYPSLVLNLDISVKILVKGMTDGLFTSTRLSNFFNSATTNWVDARTIINGHDRADDIADYAKDFFNCLK